MRPWAIIIIIVLISAMFSPVVSALPTAEHVQLVTIDPDPDRMVWNSTFNASDPANRNLSNYNQTIIPFQNNTSIDGVFTGTFLPPMVWKVADNTSFDQFYFMQLVRFKSSWIMSGSSVSWWRVPVLNITDWDYLTLFIYRVGNPGLLRLNESQPGVPNPASRPLLAYSENYWSEARNDTWYEQNVTAWGRDFTHYWLRVDAPIHSDETYLVGFYVDGSATIPDIRCQFAQTDLSDDQLYESYIHNGGSYTTLECDLDISVIHQYGMGHTVTGYNFTPEGGGGGGGGSPAYIDEPTEDIAPTGTNPGGFYDGDWHTTEPWIQVDAVDKMVGDYSIQMYTFNAGRTFFDFDTPFDLTAYGDFHMWIKTTETSNPNERIQFMDAGGNGYWRDFYFTPNTWIFWVFDFNWAGWTQTGTGDTSAFFSLQIYKHNVGYEYVNYDGIYFEDHNGSGGGGSVNSTTLKFYSRTEENVTDGDNVTFMMPFIKDITNATNAEVTIKNINGSWSESYWVAENGPTDFTIRSLPWSEVYSNKLFSINVTFQNQSNMIFIHDKYSDNYPWWHTQYPDHNFQDHYPTYVNVSTTSWRHLIWFRPYHSLQVTDGQWVQTHLDPIYMLDGRVVDPEALAFREAEQSDSWAIYLSNDELEQLANLWGIADTLMFGALPDLDAETLEHYFTKSVYNIKDVAEPIFVLVGYFVEAVDFIVDAISQMFAAVVKGIALFVFIPFFFFTCLLTNGAKRFFIITARDGPEAAVEYGSSFITNSVKVSLKSQPIALIARRGRRGG